MENLTLPLLRSYLAFLLDGQILQALDGGSDAFVMGLSSAQSQLSVLDSSSRLGLKPWQKTKPCIEILCNNQVSSQNIAAFYI
jgi:WD repeat-containing protein 48